MTLERRNGTQRALFLWVGFSFQKNDLLGCKTVFARVTSRLNFRVSRTGPHFIPSLWPILYVFLGESRDRSWIILCFQGGRKVFYSNYIGLRVSPPPALACGAWRVGCPTGVRPRSLGQVVFARQDWTPPCGVWVRGQGPGGPWGTAWGPLPRSLSCVSCIACGQ